MRHLIMLICCMLALCGQAQTVTRVSHSTAVKTDVVTTGQMTIRKPDYICISTDGGRDQLMMNGTKFTMTTKGKKHRTDCNKNPQFATFQKVLLAVINNQPIPACEDMTIQNKGGQQVITITPTSKKRQMFTSFVLVIDSKTSAMKSLRMNQKGDNYIEYQFK